MAPKRSNGTTTRSRMPGGSAYGPKPTALPCSMISAMDRNSAIGTATLGALLLATACGGRTDAPTGSATASTRTVTIYVSTDRVFSEPVLQEYERRSGVKVSPVYDTEETK